MKMLAIAAVVVAMMCGCQRGDRKRIVILDQPNAPHVKSADTESPCLQLNERQIHVLVSKVQELKIGDSRQQIKATLGAPWSDQVQQKKNASHAFVGRRVVYYVRKQKNDIANEQLDHWVEFWFDKNDRLTQIYSQNIEGIKNQP